MSFVAIVGAGPIGGALAQKLATRGRVGEIRLIDSAGTVAQGKALDILQSAPIENFATNVTAADSIHAVSGARAIVIADAASADHEHTGEAALAMVKQIAAVETSAPFVFAGTTQRELMARTVSELRVGSTRVVGAAPAALESALRALAGVMLDGSGVEVTLSIVGVPPKGAVVAWEEATAHGQPISSELPPHALAALSARIPGLWPPGPYALGSAAARVVEAIVHGSRRRYTCFVSVRPATVVAMPVELGTSGVVRVVAPTLTRQEQTTLDTAIENASRG